MYSPELAAEVCRRMSAGESLRQLCRDPQMPCTTTVLKWARDMPEFREQYAHAREDLLAHWAQEITEIADDGSIDWIERETKSGRMLTVPDQEHINRSRLRIDARKWLLSKLAPRKYGDKLELTGLPAAPPVQTADPVTLEDAERQYLGKL
jgi:hypothetical protein